VPGFLNVTVYLDVAAEKTILFRKISEAVPVDWIMCDPAAFQAQVTESPAAIVSTAGFWLPLCALL